MNVFGAHGIFWLLVSILPLLSSCEDGDRRPDAKKYETLTNRVTQAIHHQDPDIIINALSPNFFHRDDQTLRRDYSKIDPDKKIAAFRHLFRQRAKSVGEVVKIDLTDQGQDWAKLILHTKDGGRHALSYSLFGGQWKISDLLETQYFLQNFDYDKEIPAE